MAIKKIKVSNFKTFKDLDLELGSFNVVIGANASGKSNFVEIFQFLKDIRKDGLKNAVSMHGTMSSIINLKCPAEDMLRICVEKNGECNNGVVSSSSFDVFVMRSEYDISIQSDMEISEEKLSYQFIDCNRQQYKVTTYRDVKDKQKLKYDIEPPTKVREKGLLRSVSQMFTPDMEWELEPDDILVNSPYLHPSEWKALFSRISCYNIGPRRAKEPTSTAGKAELEEDGNNLAIILNNIIEDEDDRRKLCNLVKDLLPFVKEVGTEKFAEKSLMITLQEDYYENKNLRADLLSDGTVNITALIVALYFEEKEVVIVEEPERNIHPHLISRVVEMMKEASKKKQIIVTTHSPEVVKHAGLDNLLLISRDNDGFSHISRPGEKKEVKVFLENELGLDELYVQDLLSV